MKYISLLALFLLALSCKKDQVEPVAPDHLADGMLVLNEGLFQLNNSTLTWVDFKSGKVEEDLFLRINDRLLGDTGNDMLRFGSKIYVVVNVSSIIEVLDASTCKSIAQISMNQGGMSAQPRQLASYKGQVLVTSFDGYVSVVDTSLLQITDRIKVGSNPEQLVVSGDFAFVANSGGLNFEKQDSTISIINLLNKQETKVVVGLNPVNVAADGVGGIYVLCKGNFSDKPARLIRYDIQQQSLTSILDERVRGVFEFKDRLLIQNALPNSSKTRVDLFDPISKQIIVENWLDNTGISLINNIQYDSKTDRVFVMEAIQYINSGYVHVYTSGGQKINQYHVGLNPRKIISYE